MGAKFDFKEELGMSATIPEGALEEGESVALSIQPSFSGPYSGYGDMEPGSLA